MSEWPIVTLGEIAAAEPSAISKPYGSAILKEDYVATGIPVVRGINLTNGVFNDDDFVFIPETVARKMPGAQLTSGDLVVTHRGTVGQVSMIPRTSRHERYVASTSHVKVRLDPTKAHPEFFYYWFSSSRGRESILENVSTVGVPGLAQPVATVKRLRVPLPAIKEQRAIAEVLGTLDDKIATNDHVSTTSMELAGLIYDDRAQEQDSIRMSQVLNPILGGTPSKAQPEFWGGDLSWASARDVAAASHGSLLRTEDHITALAIERTKAKPLPAGSVVLTARGTVGAVARLATASSFNQSCYGFKLDRLPASLLYFGVLRAAQHAKEIAHGSVFDTISMNSFDHLFLPAWQPDELGSLSTKLDPLLHGVDCRVAENVTLAATRDALLTQLMSGKMRVREAEKKVEELV